MMFCNSRPRAALCVLVLGFFGTMAFAQEKVYEPRFEPLDPIVMGRGGTIAGAANGYQALFTNPAGFAAPNGDLTLLSQQVWVHARPDRIFEILSTLTGAPDTATVVAAAEEQASIGGVGVGGMTGFLGIVGRGLGLGVMGVVDTYLYADPFPTGIEDSYVVATLGLVAGLGRTIGIGGLDVTIGADVRPMYRVRAPLTSAVAGDLVSALGGDGGVLGVLGTLTAYQGVGVAIDVGSTVALGPFQVGMAIRDLGGTQFSYSETTLDLALSSFTDGSSGGAAESDDETKYVIPMNISFGAALHPNLGPLRYIIDPTIYADVQDVLALTREDASLLSLLNVGAEARLLSLVRVRAGLHQGYPTLGAGIKLLFAEVHAAMYSREMGRQAGDRPSSGASIEVAFRF